MSTSRAFATRRAFHLLVATVIIGLLGLAPSRASAQGNGLGVLSNGTAAVPDGTTSPVETSGSAFAGALASADPTNGAARASYPFRLEIARGKVQPTLGLDYSSLGGQREAGVGWGLSLPSIQRKNASGPPNYANDPSASTPLGPVPDRFVFGGAQLVPICQITSSGACVGAPAGEAMPTWAAAGWAYFRTEVDRSFERFFWSADHLTWVVEERSGAIQEFGQPLDAIGDTSACDMDRSSVIDANGIGQNPQGVFRWNLVRQHDAMGTVNEIQYRWSNLDEAQRAYLTDIYDTPVTPAYALGESGGRSPPVAAFAHHTHLTWAPDEQLPPSLWPRMFRATPDQLLTQVDVTSATFAATTPRALVRSYALTYLPRGTLGLGWWRTVLGSVQMTGACAGIVELATGDLPAWEPGSCPTMPPWTLGYASNYAPALATYDDSNVWQSMGGVEGYGTFVDVDGDGALDLVHAPNWPGEEDPVDNFPQYYRNYLGSGFGRMGQLTMLDPSNGDGNMEGEIFAGVSNPPEGDVQRYYTLVGNFGLNGGPGADIFTLDVTTWQYMTFSAEAISATSPSLPSYALLQPSSSNWSNAPPSSVMSRQFSQVSPVQGKIDVDGDGFLDWTGLACDGPFGSFWVGSCSSVAYTAFSVMGADGTLSPAAQSIADQIISLPNIASTPDTAALYLSDANGDGLVDIVNGGCSGLLCAFTVQLGRGDGTYHGAVTWPISAYDSAAIVAGSSYAYLHDVNGDGLADIVLSETSAIEVYLAQGILSDGTVKLVVSPLTGYPIGFLPPPAATGWTGGDALRFADLNASGVDDLVVTVTSEASGYSNPLFQPATMYYADLLGGGSPPVLQTITNGLGATTTLTYDTTAHLSALATATGSTWASQTPENVHVVTKSSTSLGGSASLPGDPYAGGPYVTTYEYANPVYDKRFREFRGFGLTRTTHVDVSNALNDDVTETAFLTEVTPPTTTPDVPWNTLVGLPVRTTTYAAPPGGVLTKEATATAGPALSTTHHQYSVTAIVAGLDGRVVRSVYPSETDVWRYASSSVSSGLQGQQVFLTDVYETELGGVVGGPIQTARFMQLLGGPSSTATSHTSTSMFLDTRGNITSSVDNGVAGADVPIERTVTWTNQGDWNWRPQTTTVGYVSGPSRTYTRAYDAFGNQTSLTAVLTGTASLVQSTVVTPTNAATDGTYVVSTANYDAFGNVSTTAGANGLGLTQLGYDGPYAQLLVSKKLYPSGSLTGPPLSSSWAYDRGFAEVTSATGVDGAITTESYEPFGRPDAIYLPNPSGPGQADLSPDIAFGYNDVASGPFQYKVAYQVLDSAGDGRYLITWSDALGRKVLDMATGGSADPSGSWICTGLTQRDTKGRMSAAYAPYEVSTFSEGVVPTGAGMNMKTFVDDPFNRVSEMFDLDGSPAVAYTYNALSRDTYDANAIAARSNGGTPNYATEKLDGHGRMIESDERTQNGGGATGLTADLIATTVTYQATGEPLSITRASTAGGGNTYTRTMQYDSLGRLVRNIEPNTSILTVEAGGRWWTYAYDLNGQLVGSSDARGCGVNYTYDGLGRELTQDYVPCEATQPPHSAPGASGVGTEVYKVYDAPEPGELTANSGLSSALAGRLAATYSRGEHTNYAYDGRGRMTQVSRQMPKPSSEAATGALANRYDPWWYRSNMLYDNANRRVGQTTGSDVAQLGLADVSGYTNLVTTTFDARDIPVQVGGSYGALVTEEQHYPNGLLQSRTFGDIASTSASYTYYTRQNLRTATVQRAFAAQWLESSSTYPLPYSAGSLAYTTPLTLEKLTFTVDAVNNPFLIADGRLASEWPGNQAPVAFTTVVYDDRYRVTGAYYGYAANVSEAQVATFVSTDPPPISFATPSTRSVSQTYQYDWQGNVTHSNDDANELLQRSSGVAVYGTQNVAPNRVQSGASSEGSYTVGYDVAGNLTSLKGTLPAASSGSLSLALTYDWDEAGRLRAATRAQVVSTRSPPREVSSTIANAYLYDGGGQRTWHSSNNTGSELYTLEVFPSLQVQRATWSGATYSRTDLTEAPYLVAGGMSYGRLVYDAAGALPSPKGVPLHVYLQIADPLGSTSSTIDRDSSELVEYVGYLAYGQTDTDYRPTRWQEFREGYRYTGKEDDYDVGLTYFGARYYVPGLNRWASADPLSIHGLRGDINPYSFVRGSPFRLVDATGLDGEAPDSPPPATPDQEPTFPLQSVPDVLIVGHADPQANDPDYSPPIYSRAVSWLQGLTNGGGGVYGPDQFGAGPLAATARLANDHRDILAAVPLLGPAADLGEGAVKAQDGDLKGAAFAFAMAAVAAVVPEEGPAERLAAEATAARTFTSADPLVADLANAIERAYPGHVVGVNVPMTNAAGRVVTDADILLQNAVIQVKSGPGKGLTTQLLNTQAATNLPVIGYGPQLGGSLVRGIQANGGLVTRDAQLLIDVVAP